MRVLHIYSGNLYGGVETALVTLSRLGRLCPGLEQHFALCFKGRLSEELTRCGAAVSFIGPVRASRPLTVRRGRARLRRILQSKKFDVAICHSTWSQALFAPAVRRENVPLLFWVHEALHGRGLIELWARLTTPMLAITSSRFSCDTLASVYPRTPAELLYLPVEPAVPDGTISRAEVRRAFGVGPETVVIIQVSRMEPGKGHRCLIEALSRLRHVPGWVCWIVGGPQRAVEEKYYGDLQRSVAHSGLAERVRMLGSRDDVPQLLQAADVYCQPNIAPETFGLTFVEALYCGLPVVTSAIGGGKEIVNERCGVLVSPNDSSAVAGSLERLICSTGLRSSFAPRAKSRARELCDPEAQMRRFETIVVRAANAA
jgi:glycosyltransferase involved in cell wall biosynthesis